MILWVAFRIFWFQSVFTKKSLQLHWADNQHTTINNLLRTSWKTNSEFTLISQEAKKLTVSLLCYFLSKIRFVYPSPHIFFFLIPILSSAHMHLNLRTNLRAPFYSTHTMSKCSDFQICAHGIELRQVNPMGEVWWRCVKCVCVCGVWKSYKKVFVAVVYQLGSLFGILEWGYLNGKLVADTWIETLWFLNRTYLNR